MALAPRKERPERSWGHLAVSGLLFAFLVATAAAGVYRMVQDGGARDASAQDGEFLFFAPQEPQPFPGRLPGGRGGAGEAGRAPAAAPGDDPDDDDFVPDSGAYASGAGESAENGMGIPGDPVMARAGRGIGRSLMDAADPPLAVRAEYLPAPWASRAADASYASAAGASGIRSADPMPAGMIAAEPAAFSVQPATFFAPPPEADARISAVDAPERGGAAGLSDGGEDKLVAALSGAAAEGREARKPEAPSAAGAAAGESGASSGQAVPAEGGGADAKGSGVRTDAKGSGVRTDAKGSGVRADAKGPGVRADAKGSGVRADAKGPGVRADAKGAAAPAPGRDGSAPPAGKGPAGASGSKTSGPAGAMAAKGGQAARPAGAAAPAPGAGGTRAAPAPKAPAPKASAPGSKGAAGTGAPFSPEDPAPAPGRVRKDGVITAVVRPSAPAHPPSAGDAGQVAAAAKRGGRPKTPVRRVVGRIALTPGNPLLREELQGLMRGVKLSPDRTGRVMFKGPGGESLTAETTLDPVLQEQAVRWVRNARSLRAALVAVDPRDGRVVAIASLGGGADDPGSAMYGGIPAASVFKIVTAAAAMEQNRYDRNSKVRYDGGKHTLFKSNVVKEPDRGIHKATLEAGFAESINSVFGKLGVYTLGPGGLHRYAEKVGFNRVIPFDMEVEPSVYDPADSADAFRLAELSSGYNRTTTVSPLHAALIAGGVMNGGLMAEPWMVRTVTGPGDRVFYRREKRPLVRVMSRKTAGELDALMLATVTDGTGRRGFWDASSHRVLSRLAIGGKSGTINDLEGRHVDWFVASARIAAPADGESRPLAIAAVVVHGGRTRETSQELVRKAVIGYYGPMLRDSRGPGRAS
jgi:hypothetical protein